MHKTLPLLLLTSLASANPGDLDILAKLADKYELPKPPTPAKLILGNTGWSSVIGNRSTAHDPYIYISGFLIDSKNKKNIKIMAGFSYRWCEEGENEFSPAARSFSFTEPKPALKGYILNDGHISNFAMAIQCTRLGLKDKAHKFVNLFKKAEFSDGLKVMEGVPEGNKLLFARIAFDYYYHEAIKPNGDLKKASQQLTKLRKEFPSLFDDGYFSKTRSTFIDDLQLTAKAIPPIPGSVQDIILKLSRSKEPNSQEYLKLKNQIYSFGIKAIPELVSLVGDKRLTSHMGGGIMKQPTFVVRIGTIVEPILYSMTAIDRQHNSVKDWNQWLKQQNFSSSLNYFKSKLFTADGEINPTILKILLSTNPKAIEKIIPQLTAKVSFEKALSLILKSQISKKIKIKILKSHFKGKKGLKRMKYVRNMLELGEDEVTAELITLIKTIPSDVNAPYWTNDYNVFAHTIMVSSSEKAWSTYIKQLKKCKVGFKMELMNPFDYLYIENKNIELRIACLASFLNDNELRVVNRKNKKWEGPHAGFHSNKLTVSNFVATTLCHMLKISKKPNEFWTEKQWKSLKDDITTKLQKRGTFDLIKKMKISM